MSAGAGRLKDAVDFKTACRLIADRLRPCAPGSVAVAQATGAVTAAPVISVAEIPGRRRSLRDGYAVQSDRLAGASPLMPIPLPAGTPYVRQGETMADSFDAVLPREDCHVTPDSIEALREVTPGAHVMPAGGRAEADAVLVEDGVRLTPQTVAALIFAGIATVAVRRPLIAIIVLDDDNAALARACAVLIHAMGVRCAVTACGRDHDLAACLAQTEADAVLAIGALDEEDSPLRAVLSAQADILASAIAVSPGAAAMLGIIDGRMVLAMPALPEAVFALTATLARLMVATLSGERPCTARPLCRLSHKIAGQAGLTRLVFVQHDGPDAVTPLGNDMMHIASLASVSGLAMVPGRSEGFAAGSMLAILTPDQFLLPDADL